MENVDKAVRQKLTPQQNYLLSCIPSTYDMKSYSHQDPPEVRRARRLIDSYDAMIKRRQCAWRKRMEALRSKAREAVYFSSPEKALAIVTQCRKMIAGCDE